jgi:hypothetical protein
MGRGRPEETDVLTPGLQLRIGDGAWMMATDPEGISRFSFEIDSGRFYWIEDTLLSMPNLCIRRGNTTGPIRLRGISWGTIDFALDHLKKWVTP